MTPLTPGRIGIRESEWRDDPEALADWDWWIQRIEPIELSPEERAEHERFEEEFRRSNLEEVYKPPPDVRDAVAWKARKI